MSVFDFGLTGQVVGWSVAAVMLYGLSRAVIRAWFREKARHLRDLMKDEDK